ATVRASARAHLTDALGGILAGHTTLHPAVRRLGNLDGGRQGPGGAARRTAFTCGVYANCWEVGAIHRASVVCPGYVVLPAVLGVLGTCPALTWEEILRACLVGYEVAVAAAIAVRGDLLIQRGWWPTALLAPLGGAAAVSVLLGHSRTVTASAIALAAQHAGGSVAGTTADSDGRYLLSGLAAERAVDAAFTAGAGWRGPLDILDDPRSPLRREPGRALPGSYLLPELSMKGHAGAKHLQAAIDAVLTVRADAGGAPVRRIECGLPARLAGVVNRPPPFGSPLNALASAQFILAVAAVRGHCTPWDFTPETLTDDTVLALARQVTVTPAASPASGEPAAWGATVDVTTVSGTVRVERRWAKGDPGNELTGAELTEKFVTLAGRSLGEGPAGELAGLLLGADGETPLSALAEYVLPLLHRREASPA
ncbi:MmgE/PrpD family protein, partial [Streptomyces sp. 150FB]|uniref:MmgE/PrpD family protein n=1 Tax=Streptomyces sp. 150FB TaxID=1576605 RepID=UPI00099C0637